MPALARNSPRAQQPEKLQTKSRGRRVQAWAPGAMSATSCITQTDGDNLSFAATGGEREGPDLASQVAGRSSAN